MNVVNLTKRVQTAKGMRYCPVVQSANGRIKPDVVIVNNKEERHGEGAYYLEWRERGKRVRLSVGKNPADADARRLRKEAELNAIARGATIVPDKKPGRSVAAAIEKYLDEVKEKQRRNKPGNLNRHNTHGVYSKALEYFTESCHKVNLEDITRDDLLKYVTFLAEDKDNGQHSAYNKLGIVVAFLKAQGIRGLVGKGDWPKFSKEEPEVYEKEELDSLFEACDPEARLWFQFFLMTGMREQEVMHVFWKDVNFNANTISVSHKPDMNWTPKSYKARTVPVPAKLMKSLKEWKTAKDEKACPLVFSTSGCRVKRDFWDCLKAVARRAELEPEKFWLHKFRSTFATWCLWSGVDLATVQLWMGHSDLESTMRYLKPSRSKETHAKVNQIFV